MVKVRNSLRAVMRFLHDSVTKWTSGIPLVALVVPIFPGQAILGSSFSPLIAATLLTPVTVEIVK